MKRARADEAHRLTVGGYAASAAAAMLAAFNLSALVGAGGRLLPVQRYTLGLALLLAAIGWGLLRAPEMLARVSRIGLPHRRVASGPAGKPVWLVEVFDQPEPARQAPMFVEGQPGPLTEAMANADHARLRTPAADTTHSDTPVLQFSSSRPGTPSSHAGRGVGPDGRTGGPENWTTTARHKGEGGTA